MGRPRSALQLAAVSRRLSAVVLRRKITANYIAFFPGIGQRIGAEIAGSGIGRLAGKGRAFGGALVAGLGIEFGWL